MEITSLHGSVGLKFNQADFTQVDKALNKIESKLRALSTNLRINIEPIIDINKVKAQLATLQTQLQVRLTNPEPNESVNTFNRMSLNLINAIDNLTTRLGQGGLGTGRSGGTRAGRPPVSPAERQANRDAELSKTKFGQRVGTVRNTFQEFSLTGVAVAGKLNTALVSLQTVNREFNKFQDAKFKAEGLTIALSNVSNRTKKAVDRINAAFTDDQQRAQALHTLSQQIEGNLRNAIQLTTRDAQLNRINAAALKDILRGRNISPEQIRARTIEPLRVSETITTLEARSLARGGFRSDRERATLTEALTTRRIQLENEVSRIQRRLSSGNLRHDEGVYRRLGDLARQLAAVRVSTNNAASRAILSSTRQAEMSFRTMAGNAFRTLNNIRIMATTVTGVMASFVGIRGFLDVNQQAEGTKAAFKSILGDGQRAGSMMQFINNEAERLGLTFGDLAKDSKNFTAAAVIQNMSLEQTQEILTSVFEASKALSLKTDDVSGGIRALGQMLSKGTVQSEELKGQLGERIKFESLRRAIYVVNLFNCWKHPIRIAYSPR